MWDRFSPLNGRHHRFHSTECLCLCSCVALFFLKIDQRSSYLPRSNKLMLAVWLTDLHRCSSLWGFRLGSCPQRFKYEYNLPTSFTSLPFLWLVMAAGPHMKPPQPVWMREWRSLVLPEVTSCLRKFLLSILRKCCSLLALCEAVMPVTLKCKNFIPNSRYFVVSIPITYLKIHGSRYSVHRNIHIVVILHSGVLTRVVMLEFSIWMPECE